tara:strand:+ start:9103 stop:9678 length:576 start_codon:yes stop_codon:yes gene_type:complete
MVAQRTFIPDDAFEQALIDLELDDVFDDSVYTSAIDTVQVLDIFSNGIADLTGVEAFLELRELYCFNNQITNLDLSNNVNLFEVNCSNNELVSLSIKNGNQTGLWYFIFDNNPDLFCVEVDNVAYAYNNWQIESPSVYSTNCNPSSTYDMDVNRRLVKIVDVFGREIEPKKNIPLFYIYDDGSVEKRNIIQ